MTRLLNWWSGIHPKRLEAVGIGLILFAAVFEFGILSNSLRAVSDGAFLDIDQKLKHIWSAIGSLDPRETVSRNNRGFWETVRVNDRLKDSRASFLVDTFNYIRFSAFFMGSVLVITAKWREGAKPGS